jgi:hypothetical protein
MDDQAQAVSLDDFAGSLSDDLENIEQPDEENEASADVEGETADTDESKEETADPEYVDEAGKPLKFKTEVVNERGEKEVKELTVKELQEGQMLRSDYHHKRQIEANETRKAQQQYYGAIEQTTKQTVEVIDQLKAFVIQSVAPDLQNLTPQLAMNDPAEYVRLDAAYKQTQQTLAQLDAHRSEAEAQQKQSEAESYQYARAGVLSLANDYLGKVAPETLKPEYREKAITFAAKTYGISASDAAFLADAPEFKQGGVFDSGKFVHILNDAMKYHAMQANKPIQMNKVAQAPKTIRPQSQPQAPKNAKTADRLAKLGRVEDFAAFL